VEIELDFNIDEHSHGHSILAAGFDSPVPDGVNRFFVETHAEGLDDSNVMGTPMANHDKKTEKGTKKKRAPPRRGARRNRINIE